MTVTPTLMLLVGLCWLAIGFILGNFVAINRLIHNEELKQKLEDLREIRYEADRARTLHHVAKMMERVNRNLLLEIIEQFDKDLKEHIRKVSQDKQNG